MNRTEFLHLQKWLLDTVPTTLLRCVLGFCCMIHIELYRIFAGPRCLLSLWSHAVCISPASAIYKLIPYAEKADIRLHELHLQYSALSLFPRLPPGLGSLEYWWCWASLDLRQFKETKTVFCGLFSGHCWSSCSVVWRCREVNKNTGLSVAVCNS